MYTQTGKGTTGDDSQTYATPESAQWLYDELMRHIEPDLMSENINNVEEKYKNETLEEKAARMERYSMAFVVLQECLKDMSQDSQLLIKDLNTLQSEDSKKESQEEAANVLQQIEYNSSAI